MGKGKRAGHRVNPSVRWRGDDATVDTPSMIGHASTSSRHPPVFILHGASDNGDDQGGRRSCKMKHQGGDGRALRSVACRLTLIVVNYMAKGG